MTDGSQFIDIILFAMVALFLGLRLRSVLGRRTGHEQPPADVHFRGQPPVVPPAADNVVDIANRRPAPAIAETPLDAGLREVAQADPNFTPEGFLQGATAAFEMIVAAFAKDDLATLRPLLSDEVFGNFSKAIEGRKQAGETCQSELVKIVTAEINEARLDKRMAEITVRFVSQQVIVIKDKEDRVIEGDPSRAVQIIDLWSFARDTRTTNPNWLLVATRSLDE
ncbi:Tim44/TimA family putative adaptor protein [Telmatospirillum sp.]|uniref:Tim44/TimA family putative adaptor protein n=1 Tax=Telmatospirillum sp. TaxID=2079197 RepID=UPI0028490862|nr:Tim44/TimA family putative adaptor protein [Telmatospirillum sp.]MDR3439614.1 Tim44/TimA family putative adaptor protein [Telmatospirillum sp.]